MVDQHSSGNASSLRDQFGPRYTQFSDSDAARHLALLDSVGRDEDVAVADVALADVAVSIEDEGEDRWTITVSTWDWLGTLSILAGLISVYGLDITSVDVFTLTPVRQTQTVHAGPLRRGAARRRSSPPTRPEGKVLDIFSVKAIGPSTEVAWDAFRADLGGLIGLLVQGFQDQAREEITDRYTVAAKDAGDVPGYLPAVSVQVDNESLTEFTLLKIRSQDTTGFLFAFTNAMAVLNINVAGAEVRTVGNEVRDTFWLTDQSGHKIQSKERVQQLRVATSLIKQFTHLLPLSPNPTLALRQFQALVRQMLSSPQWASETQGLQSATVLETLAELMGVSQFLWEDFLRMQHENLYPVVVNSPDLDRNKSVEQLTDECCPPEAASSPKDERVKQLNRFKDREMFRIDLRHITGRIPFSGFSRELSDLAEVVVREAAQVARIALDETHGRPLLQDGRDCPWCICALGKFGGRELGFGSDVEILFVYEEEGTTSHGPSVPNSVYFADLVREFSRTIVVRREGIFEVDLRLRPYSNDGPLAVTMDGFNAYYSEEGNARNFERLALVKLRPVAGDPELGARVSQCRDNFVYSAAELDVENILHLRRRQATELVTPETTNAKYSPGGLVDVEYYVQALQILMGNGDPSVRRTNTLDAIQQLVRRGHLSQTRGEELEQAYGFLRQLIDALRAVRGHAKDLTIPALDAAEFTYLARRLNFESTELLQDAIATNMGQANNIWDQGILSG